MQDVACFYGVTVQVVFIILDQVGYLWDPKQFWIDILKMQPIEKGRNLCNEKAGHEGSNQKGGDQGGGSEGVQRSRG